MEPHLYSLFGIAFRLFAVLFLVLLNGFFVAAEFAIVKVRSTQIETLVKKHHRRARVADNVIQHLDAYLSATQLGITLASLGLGWLGEPFVAVLLESVLASIGIESKKIVTLVSLGVAFAIITFLHIVLGELAPKSLAIQRARQTTLWVAIPLTFFYKLFFPAIWALNQVANWVLRIIGLEPVSEGELAHSEEELRLLLAESGNARSDNSISRAISLKAFSLKSLKARNIMLPRNKIVALYAEQSAESNLRTAEASRHTRFPLCRETMDQVIGMVHVKDLLWQIHAQGDNARIEAIRREILFIPELVNLETLLSMFLDKKCHMAIVVDEFGGTLGMVTLEDVLEELVGEIQDEFDQEQPLITQIQEKEYLVDGATPLHDVEEAFGVRFNDENDAATLGGYLVDRWQEIPPEGTEWNFENLKFVVQKVEKFRVSQVRVKVEESSSA
ncbi:MAG: hemolysin family protein [Acidobacteria bacterium]|nr:hemolysin family protein [Acidobacteriota bacterium]MCI0623391.1 hemolysin family protein [Acidobacteriota bacterium]MCI0724201.1 hemolysin family protein [Acidobacteriota bacterium]